ncbi:Sh3 domain-containing protein, partial [Globisporangium splendens]
MICSTCGIETPTGTARFCANCGARFPDQHDDTPVLFPPRDAPATGIPVAVPVSAAYQGQETQAYYPPVPPAAAYPPSKATPLPMATSFNDKSVGNGVDNGQPPMANEAYADRGSTSSEEGTPRKSGGFLKGRYADHPNCDVCKSAFDIAKRRHQCRKCGRYICGSCSPVRLLIPYGEQIEDAKGYDTSVPQRVCLHCAPELQPLQEQLAAMYARANADNSHEAKGRIHAPYTDSLAKECQNAADIIGNFFRDDNAASSDRSIPIAFLEKAQGLAIMTIVKAGFMIAGKIGTGLVIARLPDGSWSAPSAIGTAGLSTGFQIGGEIVEVMIILGSQGAVQVFHKPQVNVGAGLDVAVGPYGRAASAQAAVSTTNLNANYSYSQSKGLFAGIALQGSVILARNDLNRKFYGQDLEPSELLSGSVGQPRAAQPLYDAIDRAMRGIQEHKDVQEEMATMMGACRRCTCQRFVAHQHQIWNKKCKTCDHIH